MAKRRSVHRFTALSGLEIKIYRIKPEDAVSLVDLFEHLSPASRYQRFREVLNDPDPEYVRQTAQRMATVDPRHGAAWLAVANLPGQGRVPVGGSRYMRLPDRKSAEVSIAIRDDMQRQGIGAEMLHFLARHARNNGVQRLMGSFDTSNRAVWKLVRSAPFEVTTTIYGSLTEVIIDLSKPDPVGKTPHASQEQAGSPVRLQENTMQATALTNFRLSNGLEIRIRPQTPGDVTSMAELFEQGSREKRLERAVQGGNGPSDQAIHEAMRLVQLAPQDGCVWLAFTDLPGHPNSLVASGRLMRCMPEEAEMSIVVRDDMQGQGIGSKLLYFVLEQARALGINRVASYFASDNEAVWQILSYSPYHITWQPRGKQVEATIHLQARSTASPSHN